MRPYDRPESRKNDALLGILTEIAGVALLIALGWLIALAAAGGRT